MKRVLLAILLIFVFCSASTAAIKDSPDGFRGIKWGDPAGKYPDLRLVKEQTREDGVIIKDYTREEDSLSMGDAKLEKITYRFFDDEFVVIEVLPQKTDYKLLLKVLKIRFGEPEQPVTIINAYEWEDENVGILYVYTKSAGVVTILSKPLIDKYSEKLKKAEEAAIKKDF